MAVSCTVTKPREWEVRLLLMNILPDLRLKMAEYEYLANSTIENVVWFVGRNPMPERKLK